MVLVQLSIYIRAEGRKTLFELHIVLYTITDHLGDQVNCFLEFELSVVLEDAHEVLVISVCLFFLIVSVSPTSHLNALYPVFPHVVRT